jgi:predicted porin
MNKKLMAVAVAGALTAPGLAVAQVGGSPGVSLYGRLDTAVMIQNFSDNGVQSGGGVGIPSVKKNDIFSPGNALGFRGREDLGGGTAAWFQLEAGVWPDGRLEAGATTGAHFGGRNSAVGFSSTGGDVLFGIWDTPYKVAYGTANLVNSGGFASSGIIMGNGDTTGALNNPLCGNVVNNASGTPAAGPNSVCVTEATSNGTAWSRRINNSIQYWSPVFSGVQFKLMTALANYQSPDSSQPNGTPKPKEYSANVTWARGPLALAFGYDSHEGLRPTPSAVAPVGVVPVGGVPNPKDTAVQIGGKWDFGMAQVGAGLEQLKYANNAISGAVDTGMKVSNMVINGRVNAGPGQVWASWSQTPGGKSCTQPAAFNPNTGTGNLVIGGAACGGAGKAKMLTVGYDYVMSKRTKMYVAYNKIDNGISTNYYYIAGPAANAGNGTNGGLSPGTDVTTVALGIQHTF